LVLVEDKERSRVFASARLAATLLLVGVFIQIALGIATLLLAVPVGLGAAHQGGAMVVLGLLLWLNHELRAARVPGDSDLTLNLSCV
jgi:cytochrome c oxidase assembly protein subunit 15